MNSELKRISCNQYARIDHTLGTFFDSSFVQETLVELNLETFPADQLVWLERSGVFEGTYCHFLVSNSQSMSYLKQIFLGARVLELKLLRPVECILKDYTRLQSGVLIFSTIFNWGTN